MRHLVRPAALIANYFDTLPPNQSGTAQAIHQAVLSALPGMDQSLKWGNLMFLFQGQRVAALVLHKGQAHLQVVNGAALADAFPMLEGVGRGMRLLKFRYGQPVEAELIGRVMRAAVVLPAPEH